MRIKLSLRPVRLAALFLAAALAAVAPRTGSAVSTTFTGPDLDNASYYVSTRTLPNNTTDVALYSTAANTISTASLAMQSLDTLTGNNFSVQNATTGATNTTITLGNSSFTNGFSAVASDLIYVPSGSLTLQGSNTSGGTGTFGLVLAASGNFNATGTLSISAVISDNSGGFGVTKTGAGSLTLSGANTFSGGLTVSTGTLTLANALAAQNSTLSLTGRTMAFDSGVTTNAFTVGGLSGSGNLVLANNAATPAAVALTAGGNNASTTYSGSLSGAGSLTKTGTGLLTLSGANSYAGATTVSAGTLAVNGSLPGAGALTVGTGGTLAGTGSVAGAVNVQAGSAFTPGIAGGGKLTLGSTLTLTGAATANFTLSGTAGNTQAAVAGQVNLGAGATLNLTLATGALPTVGQVFYLIDSTGTTLIAGAFTNALLTGSTFTQNGVTYRINYAAQDPADTSNALLNDISVTVTAIPEPGTWTLLFVGAGLLVLTFRRRSHA